MIGWIIALIIYLTIAYFVYGFKIQYWKHPKWQKIVFSIAWPCIAILYGIKSLLRPGY